MNWPARERFLTRITPEKQAKADYDRQDAEKDPHDLREKAAFALASPNAVRN